MTPIELRDAHRVLGFTTVKLAAVLGVTTRTVQMWENGKTAIPEIVARVIRLILAGRLDPADILEMKS